MKLMSIFYRATVTLVATTLFSLSAFAQSTILVVDQSRLLRDSEVGKHIQRQLESIGNSMKSELEAQASPLKSEGSTLQAEIKALGGTDMSSRPDLKSRLNAFAGKSQKAQMEAAYKQRELAMTEAKAYQKVNEKLRVILEQVVAERNADIIIDRSAVIYGKPADVTDLVMSRLNSQVKSVSVARERLPRQ